MRLVQVTWGNDSMSCCIVPIKDINDTFSYKYGRSSTITKQMSSENLSKKTRLDKTPA